MTTDTPHDYFRAAFNYYLKHKWQNGQKTFAAKVKFSQSTISEVKTGKANASIDLQLAICNVFESSYEDMIRFGRSLLNPKNTTSGITARNMSHGFGKSATNYVQQERSLTVVSDPPNTIQKNEHLDHKADKMHKDLDVILQSGDEELIDAIRINLVSFRKKVELQKQVEAQGERIAVLEAIIKN